MVVVVCWEEGGIWRGLRWQRVGEQAAESPFSRGRSLVKRPPGIEAQESVMCHCPIRFHLKHK